MAQMTQARSTSQYAGEYLVLPVKAGMLLYAGTLVAVDDTGQVVPAAKAEGLIAAGRAEMTVDNRDREDGAMIVKVLRGVFRWDNDPANPVTAASVLSPCYMLDNCTVTALAAGSSEAGRVLAVDADGVTVETR